jgi:hypothetical protein
MQFGMASRAQRNQVLLRVGSQMAAEFSVVHLEIRYRAAGLTSPSVTTQDLLVKPFV